MPSRRRCLTNRATWAGYRGWRKRSSRPSHFSFSARCGRILEPKIAGETDERGISAPKEKKKERNEGKKTRLRTREPDVPSLIATSKSRIRRNGPARSFGSRPSSRPWISSSRASVAQFRVSESGSRSPGLSLSVNTCPRVPRYAIFPLFALMWFSHTFASRLSQPVSSFEINLHVTDDRRRMHT